MIDPDSIIVQKHNENNKLKFNNIPEYDYNTYDLEDTKQVNKFFKNI
jgi:protein-tyrosine phosphatase